MSLALHPEHLRATYDYLRAFKPFCRWRLPVGEEVAFKVTADPNTAGFYQWLNASHWIGVSAQCAGMHETVLKITAHEMIHLKQQIDGQVTSSMHNADFRRRAVQVCREWGWDAQDFYY